MIKKPVTLVRVANYSGRIEDAMKAFSDKSFRLDMGRTDVIKYVAYDSARAYFLIASQREDRKASVGYDFLVTLCSNNRGVNLKVVEEFKQKTGVQLRTGPKKLSELFKKMMESSISLEDLESDSDRFLENLKRVYQQSEFLEFLRNFESN